MKKSNETSKTSCPVCGKPNVREYDICSGCGWENDPIQLNKPSFKGGANKMSLEKAKKTYGEGLPIE